MLFRIAKENQERAGKAFTVEREKNNFGYKKSGILKPKSNRIMHYYEVDMLDADRIICTVRHKNTDCIVALVCLSGYTPESIEVDQAELYRNCSNYPYRREYNEKYLKKYDQIACIVHGAIAAGLLYDTQEATTSAETIEDKEITTKDENRPQEATETAQKTADDTTTAGSDTDQTEAAQAAEKTIITGARLYSHPHRHIVTVAGLQDGLVMVVYRGRLYLVSRADLYTDETETTQEAPQTAGTSEGGSTTTPPNTEPPRDTDAATTGRADRTTGAITPPRHACQNAPGRAERAQAEQVHTTHAKSPPRAPQRATTHGRPRGHPEKTANFGRFYPLLDFPRTIFANFQGVPISVCIFGPKIFEKFQGQKSPCRGG